MIRALIDIDFSLRICYEKRMPAKRARSLLLLVALTGLSPFLSGESSRSERRIELNPFAGQFPKSGKPSPTSHTVDVSVGSGGLVFTPSTVNVSVGDTVRWTWATSNHSVTSGNCCSADNKFCSPNDTSCSTAALSNAGAIYSHTFTQAGSYPYFCRLHGGSGMVGTVNVAAPPLQITAVSRPTSGMSAGHFLITGLTNPNLSVSISGALDLATLVTQPTPLGTVQSDSNGVFQFDAANLTIRFYRASLP